MEKKSSMSGIIMHLTPQAFREFGNGSIAYVRSEALNDRTAWSICAADGTPISVHLTENAALAATRQRALRPMRVH